MVLRMAVVGRTYRDVQHGDVTLHGIHFRGRHRIELLAADQAILTHGQLTVLVVASYPDLCAVIFLQLGREK